jgi:hypothetical protein
MVFVNKLANMLFSRGWRVTKNGKGTTRLAEITSWRIGS